MIALVSMRGNPRDHEKIVILVARAFNTNSWIVY